MPSPTIVLVHGAFGDASSWRPVFDRLVGDGHTVLAPPNPLRGLPYDASYTASVIDQLDGPVVLVGHSYGGAVITVAGSSDKVAGLVYVAGVAPDEGESVNDLQGRFPSLAMGPLVHALRVGRRQCGGVDRPRAVPRCLLRRPSGRRRRVHGDLAAPGLGHGVRRSRDRRRLADEAVLGGVRHRRLPGRTGAAPLLLRPRRLHGHRGRRRLPLPDAVAAGHRRKRHSRGRHAQARSR